MLQNSKYDEEFNRQQAGKDFEGSMELKNNCKWPACPPQVDKGKEIVLKIREKEEK